MADYGEKDDDDDGFGEGDEIDLDDDGEDDGSIGTVARSARGAKTKCLR